MIFLRSNPFTEKESPNIIQTKFLRMGLEIRDVAEQKAKEINQAYEFFRKKFSS